MYIQAGGITDCNGAMLGRYTHFWYPSILGGPPKVSGGYPYYQGYTYLNPLVSWLESILKIKVSFVVLGFEKKN